MGAITGYHAHVYYDASTREQALALCQEAGQRFGIKVGRMHDNPVGPHPRGSCQLTVPAEQFGAVIPWLIEHRNGLTVFTHAESGNALRITPITFSGSGRPSRSTSPRYRSNKEPHEPPA
jgi:aromatic ring-cleaving dioxygenase